MELRLARTRENDTQSGQISDALGSQNPIADKEITKTLRRNHSRPQNLRGGGRVETGQG